MEARTFRLDSCTGLVRLLREAVRLLRLAGTKLNLVLLTYLASLSPPGPVILVDSFGLGGLLVLFNGGDIAAVEALILWFEVFVRGRRVGVRVRVRATISAGAFPAMSF